MARIIRLAIVLVAGALAGCGLADSNASFIPSVLRQPPPPPPQPDPPPDVRTIVQASLGDLFVDGAHPAQIRVSQPMARVEGHSWNACVEAQVLGINGNPIVTQLLIEIADGKIRDRRRAPEGGPCAQVSYEPI